MCLGLGPLKPCGSNVIQQTNLLLKNTLNNYIFMPGIGMTRNTHLVSILHAQNAQKLTRSVCSTSRHPAILLAFLGEVTSREGLPRVGFCFSDLGCWFFWLSHNSFHIQEKWSSGKHINFGCAAMVAPAEPSNCMQLWYQYRKHKQRWAYALPSHLC